MIIADADIGGGRVRRPFTRAGKYLKPGTELSRDEILAMPHANRQALIDSTYLEVWPAPKVSPIEGASRHVISRGFARFDVIYGVKLNKEPLTKDEADALAASD